MPSGWGQTKNIILEFLRVAGLKEKEKKNQTNILLAQISNIYQEQNGSTGLEIIRLDFFPFS